MGRQTLSAVILLVVLFAVFAATRHPAMPALFRRAEPPAVTLERISPRISAPTDAAIQDAVQRFAWTEYEDYGTVRIGRVARPARLFSRRTKWTTQLAVPSGGARYEVFVGAIDTAARVRVGRAGDPPDETQVEIGNWTRVTLDLDSRAGTTQTVAVDIEPAPGGVVALGSELVVPSQRDASRPDVILISLDTVRRDQLTPYAPAVRSTLSNIRCPRSSRRTVTGRSAFPAGPSQTRVGDCIRASTSTSSPISARTLATRPHARSSGWRRAAAALRSCS